MSSKTKTGGTQEEATPALVPKLRFPEFRGAEAWRPYLLEELEDLGWVELGRGEVISGQDIKAVPGDYPIYSSSVKNNGLMGTYGQFMFDEELISWSVDGGGDFFHRPRHKFSVTNVSGYMRLNTSHLNYRFLASHLQALHASLTFDYQLKAHPSVIRKLYRLAIPTPAEQQAIAECLSSADELIAAQARKVDVLKTHKKGLMQQLFPREGETQPRGRFPEFQNAGEWAGKALEDIAPLQRGFDLPADGIRPGSVPIVYSNGPRGFHERGMARGPGLITGRSGTLGKLHFVESGDYWPHNTSLWVTSFRGHHPRFVYYLYEFIGFLRFTSGSGVPTLNRNDAHSFETSVPSSLAEQKSIASCLSSLDARITAEAQKLATLKTHKKGLMQQLFPPPAAVEA